MRTYPTDESEFKEAARLGAPTWMLDALKMNPSYPFWGNHEDYMCGKDAGWREAQEVAKVADLWPQDDMNELVHGYYFIDRDGAPCDDCERSGYNPATRKIADDWYGFRDPRDRWDNKLTQDEVVALVEEGRLWDLTKGFRGHYDRETSRWVVWQDGKMVPYKGIPYIPTPEEVNAWPEPAGSATTRSTGASASRPAPPVSGCTACARPVRVTGTTTRRTSPASPSNCGSSTPARVRRAGSSSATSTPRTWRPWRRTSRPPWTA